MSEAPHESLEPLEWPAGHRAALAVVVDLDHSGLVKGATRQFLETGATRLLAMLADLDIAPTVVLDASAIEPARIPGDIDVDPAARLESSELSLQDAVQQFESTYGLRPKGAVVDRVDLALADDMWVIDGTASPFPYRNHTNSVVIPANPWWQDRTWLGIPHPAPPSSMLEHWSTSLASVRTYGELMTVGLSAEVGGHPGHVETIQRFLDETIAAGDVWITNCSGIADHVRPHHGE